MVSKVKGIIGKLLFWVFLVGLIYFFFDRATEVKDVGDAVLYANKFPFILAILLQIIWLLVYALILKALYKAIDISVRYRDVFTTYTTQVSLGVTTPFASWFGLIYEASRLGKLGKVGRTEAFIPLVTTTLLEYSGILVYLVIGIVILSLNGISYEKEVIAGLLLALVCVAILGAMLIAALFPEKLDKASEDSLIGRFIRYFIGKFSKNQSDEWISERIWRLNKTVKTLYSNKGSLFKGIALSTLLHTIRLVIFGLMFIAFNLELNLAAIFTGYTLTYVFSVMSPTPLGIGVVETVVPLILISMGVPKSSAFLLVLAYRAITIWFIVIYGFFAYRIQDRRSNSISKEISKKDTV